ncbi:MAG: hypothetical protein ACYTFM_03725, partial [Planctomycetota bacterium]
MGKISKLTTFVIFSCFGILYGAEYDIKTITTIMDNYEKKIDSIKLRYSYESFVIDKEENRHFTRGSFAQKKSDGYVLLDEISQKGKTWDNNKEASGIARSYNGKVTRYLEHEKNNHGYHMAALYENHNPNLYKTRYNPYYFFWGINYKNKFTDLLNDPNGMVEIEGEEVVNGAKAIKINFKAAEGFLDCHLWLLPEKNYLPVKFTSFKATDEGRIKEMHWSEFKQFTGGIWYPMNINLYFKDVKEPVIVKIEEMDISPLTKEDFEFKFPEFTHVTDHVAGVSYLTTEPISRGEKTKCQTEQADNLNSKVFLDKYNLYNQKFQTIYYELETTIQTGIRKIVYTLEHCSRNKEKQWIGRVKYYNEDGTLDPYNNQLVVDTCDEKQWITLLSYSPEVENTRPPRATLWRSKRDKILQQNSETGSYGGPIAGRVWGSNGHSIYDLLKGASNLKLQNKVTKIIGYYTNLVDANTKYGIVKAWISPDVDYNCLKWEIIKEQNQFYRDGTTTDDKFTKWIASYYAEKVEQIDGQYIVTQARFNFTLKDGDKII